jgi:hypothetical protein
MLRRSRISRGRRARRRAVSHKPPFETTIRPDGIRNTERIWIRYRDEWVRFGALHYPRVDGDSWKTWVTLARVKLLEAIE